MIKINKFVILLFITIVSIAIYSIDLDGKTREKLLVYALDKLETFFLTGPADKKDYNLTQANWRTFKYMDCTGEEHQVTAVFFPHRTNGFRASAVVAMIIIDNEPDSFIVSAGYSIEDFITRFMNDKSSFYPEKCYYLY